jgi:hypothetical protein
MEWGNRETLSISALTPHTKHAYTYTGGRVLCKLAAGHAHERSRQRGGGEFDQHAAEAGVPHHGQHCVGRHERAHGCAHAGIAQHVPCGRAHAASAVGGWNVRKPRFGSDAEHARPRGFARNAHVQHVWRREHAEFLLLHEYAQQRRQEHTCSGTEQLLADGSAEYRASFEHAEQQWHAD